MIFDCAAVTELVLEYQAAQDDDTLDEIMQLTKPLVEAIISGYDPQHRDDLIQNAYVRVLYSIPYYDSGRANLHTYFTTVIRNSAATYLKKQSRYIPEDTELTDEYYDDNQAIGNDSVLQDLIVRNRKRFPSIPVSIIDEMSNLIWMEFRAGSKQRDILSMLCDLVQRNVASIVLTSSIIYLRWKYKNHIPSTRKLEMDEFSVLPDLKSVLGEKEFIKLSKLLSGIHIRLP